jgi:hypothetical protein
MQVPPDVRERMVAEIERVVLSTSQSNIPSIYGMAAAVEVKRLRPAVADAAQVRLVTGVLSYRPTKVVHGEFRAHTLYTLFMVLNASMSGMMKLMSPFD